jgi:outer membrane protein
MRKLSLVVVLGLLLCSAAFAQAPAATAPGAGKVAVVDFQRLVTENADGKKAKEKFEAELNKRQKEFEDKQKAMTDAQTKLQTGDKTLNDTVKADLSKQIDKLNTELQRMNDDAQKELGELQQSLFRPIMEKAQAAVGTYSTENGFAVVFDASSQASNIVHYDSIADITTEIIRRMDAMPSKPAATGPATPSQSAAPKPAGGAPAATQPPAPKPTATPGK